ncbi:YdiU family protein [Legionella sp. MW5194]|uniref:protein adenylyltransferase SelO n=1 Tax=Legionella sp. MW5194 TaxID=2662448 RepID=UPI00193DE4E6|nr:YdiU family protein [Legionella sp. MW5194]QRN03252.1 YdiU family protein [Legionella sp. MW5194]
MRLHFDNSFARLPDTFYTLLDATPVTDCELIHVNERVALHLGIGADLLSSPSFAHYFGGNQRLPGSKPLAMVYAGHQFGYYVPQLGDGRALLLGELINPKGERFDIQLKGSGQTPYSRMGDGRAVLRSTVREYLASEALHALGIPTTQALCIVATHEPVYRHVPEPGAVLTRVAESHIRIGHFEYFYYTQQFEAVKQLADYVLSRHYPDQPHDEKGYACFFKQAVLRTARLIAQWQAVGFCHGVMNTDNMSVLGLTIDYGPFGFLDAYDAQHVCNSSDEAGRYAFDRQPAIAFWNLMAFAQALTPLLPQDTLRSVLDLFQPELVKAYSELMRKKMGWQLPQEEDMEIVNAMLNLMQQHRLDYTLFLRTLSDYALHQDDRCFDRLTCRPEALKPWLEAYATRCAQEPALADERSRLMKGVNPKYILRNYLAQQAIDAAYQHQDYSEIDRLFRVLQKPFDEQPDKAHYAQLPPEWAARISVSCSS